jgi:hypothetical protein
MTPRVRLALPGLLGLALVLTALAVAGPAAAVSPPCNERTNYGECRAESECLSAGGLQCACDWDSVSDIIIDGVDICAGQNLSESDDPACKVWDAEKYPDQPFCTPAPCAQWDSLAECVPQDCLVYYDINGDPCDPATCVWVDVSQDACDCHWDFPAFTVEGVTSCTDFLDDLTNNECFFEYSPSVNFCTLNPVVHCVEKPRCDVDENGQIDSVDVDAIYARLGQAATDECDPADVTQSGEISIVDASQCAEQCTYANCRTSPPSGCGLGAELVLALPLLLGMRSRLRDPRSSAAR